MSQLGPHLDKVLRKLSSTTLQPLKHQPLQLTQHPSRLDHIVKLSFNGLLLATIQPSTRQLNDFEPCLKRQSGVLTRKTGEYRSISKYALTLPNVLYITGIILTQYLHTSTSHYRTPRSAGAIRSGPPYLTAPDFLSTLRSQSNIHTDQQRCFRRHNLLLFR